MTDKPMADCGMPKIMKAPHIEMLDPVYVYPSGKDKRRERRKKERKNKKK